MPDTQALAGSPHDLLTMAIVYMKPKLCDQCSKYCVTCRHCMIVLPSLPPSLLGVQLLLQCYHYISCYSVIVFLLLTLLQINSLVSLKFYIYTEIT